MKKERLVLYDNDTLKWAYDGKHYCLHIQRDDFAESPRDWDNLAVMACWHRSYRLGDKIDENSPELFWVHLVRQYVPTDEIVSAAKDGKLAGIRVEAHKKGRKLLDVYETYYLDTVLGKSEASESLEYEGIPEDALFSYIEDDLTIAHCMTLLEPYAEWMPLWLYDHGGISMSCGRRTYPYSDRWDSGQVGWIVTFKKKIMEETVEILKDDGGEPIPEEHLHPDGSVTYGLKTRPLTEETWRARAIEIMEAEVDTYDQFLTGEVYGYTLYEADSFDDDDVDWGEIDSCWGFYGDNLLENGILDQAGCGAAEAVKSKEYETGTAEKVTTVTYKF